MVPEAHSPPVTWYALAFAAVFVPEVKCRVMVAAVIVAPAGMVGMAANWMYARVRPAERLPMYRRSRLLFCPRPGEPGRG